MNNYFAGKPTSIAFSLLFASVSLTTTAYAAEDYICEAKQHSRNELAVLAESCPIGKGLWGRKPAQDRGFFWIQCGIFPQPLSLAKAKSIYEKISTDVWLQPEGNGFRCLIGPYDSYKKANAESKQLRALPAYKESFVRSVVKNGQTGKVAPAKKPTPNPLSKQAVTAKKTPKPAPTVEKKTKPVRKPSPAPKVVEPVAKTAAKTKSKPATAGVTFRRKAEISGKLFVVPFLEKSNEQFYMEYGIAWNRLDYAKAQQVCTSQGMSLVDEQQWKTLLSSNVMNRYEWPLHLPYWGKDKRGLFTSGKVTQLTGTSLLNVVCVK